MHEASRNTSSWDAFLLSWGYGRGFFKSKKPQVAYNKSLVVYFGARDGNRTRTNITVHRILSPACLPIPPPEPIKERP